MPSDVRQLFFVSSYELGGNLLAILGLVALGISSTIVSAYARG